MLKWMGKKIFTILRSKFLFIYTCGAKKRLGAGTYVKVIIASLTYLCLMEFPILIDLTNLFQI